MPKRPINVDDIQLVSNKVDAAELSADWTAEQYPSAKTLYDIYNRMYPIGGIVCMSTNKNPGDADALGIGTWTLAWKELKEQWVTISEGNGWTGTNATISSGALNVKGTRFDFRGNIKLTKATADTTTALGTIDTTIIGLTKFPFKKDNAMFTIDGDSVTGCFVINTDGVLSINDAWTPDGTHAFTYANYPIPIHFTFTIPNTDSLMDSFCDKFYFKRTA